ncbi:hypothetical protein SELMODRAFT_425773 [Selaginella moellendorffii]|uniref:Uncharacterized protein n=1 Tax=Selaginella moellendorffii TaxID=88036 RepID=D8SU89_SELML|nr:hypothetical protein SELMODRAFT_425773 [Selaginella moellendorffii]
MFRDIEVFLKLAVPSAIMSVWNKTVILFRTSAKSPGIGLFDHFSFVVTLGLVLVKAKIMVTILFLARKEVAKAYSRSCTIPLISFMDDIQGSISGVARAYYIVGVPIAYIFAVHFGLNRKL